MTDATELLGTLRQVVAVLAGVESSWSASIAAVGADIESASDARSQQAAIRRLLAIYGGMGSFNDVVLQSPQGILDGNDQLDQLRHRMYEQAVDLVGPS